MLQANERFMVECLHDEPLPDGVQRVDFAGDLSEAKEIARDMGGLHVVRLLEWNGSEYQHAL